MYLGKSRDRGSNRALVLNIKTCHISPQYHCVYDNDFTSVTATKEAEKIKLWSGLYKDQPDNRKMDNDLDVMKNTFEMKAHPRLSILDVVICMTSSGKSTLVSIYILVNPRTKRQINRDKTPSKQNNSIPCTVPDSTIIEKSRPTNNFLSPTVHTDLDHSNSDKITLRNISDQSFRGS